MTKNDKLWRVNFTVRNEEPKYTESCVFGDGTLYVEADDIYDAIQRARFKLEQLDYDKIDIYGCQYGAEDD